MAPVNGPIIELRGVEKRFGSLEVLRGIDLALEKGKTTVVLGESGTGKSVLLKHMVGLLKPDRGQVYIDGERVDQYSEKQWVTVRKRFGYLFQLNALFDSMTVGENVAFPLVEEGGHDRDAIARAVKDKLERVGLPDIEHKLPAQLSGGQKKRVALARAIILEPDVILYDEPTTGLDPIRTDSINELILKLQRDLKVTSVVVTHDMATAFKVSDRMIMLKEGQFVADGTADDFRNSDDPYIRQFISFQGGIQVKTQTSQSTQESVS